MTVKADVIIVGAGHAGAACAIALGQAKFQGRILVIGDEPELPYERPALSKEYLAGDKPFERMLIRPENFWAERGVEFLHGARVVAVDPARHEVATDTGRTIGYGHLVWAAGGSARSLTCGGAELAGVHAVRNRADVDRMMAELDGVRRVAVIGGGYIGLEAAAVLTKLGKQVTLVEALDRVLARVAGVPLSRYFEDQHRAHGVDLRLDSAVDCILGTERATGVRLTSGDVIDADMVIVGIGIVPEVAPLIAAGAEGGNGVRVDAHCRTSLPDIYAIGDCALHANSYADGAAIRLESVQNANDQGVIAAKAIVGAPVEYDAVPWFWSNQYDLKLQTVGLSSGHDQTVLRGDPDSGSFSVIYLKEGRVIALDCVNSIKDYVQGRQLVVNRAQIDPALLADAGIPIKQMLQPMGANGEVTA